MNACVNASSFENPRLSLVLVLFVPNLETNVGENDPVEQIEDEGLALRFEHPEELEMHKKDLPDQKETEEGQGS